MAKKKPRRWIAAVRAGMEKKGTAGAFTRQAKREGMTVQQFAARVLASPQRHTTRTVKRARLARTFGELGAKRSGKKLPPLLKVARKRAPKRRATRRAGAKRRAA